MKSVSRKGGWLHLLLFYGASLTIGFSRGTCWECPLEAAENSCFWLSVATRKSGVSLNTSVLWPEFLSDINDSSNNRMNVILDGFSGPFCFLRLLSPPVLPQFSPQCGLDPGFAIEKTFGSCLLQRWKRLKSSEFPTEPQTIVRGYHLYESQRRCFSVEGGLCSRRREQMCVCSGAVKLELTDKTDAIIENVDLGDIGKAKCKDCAPLASPHCTKDPRSSELPLFGFEPGVHFPLMHGRLYFSCHADEAYTLEAIRRDKSLFYFSSTIPGDQTHILSETVTHPPGQGYLSCGYVYVFGNSAFIVMWHEADPWEESVVVSREMVFNPFA
jgi:hypothetical protein